MSTRTVTAAELQAFYNALPVGREHAVTARKLAVTLSLGRSGDRLLRALAEQATEQGMLIAADDCGYFRPATAAELESTIARLRSQSTRMAIRARRLQALADAQFGQQQTFGI